jgi:hypothetical protein
MLTKLDSDRVPINFPITLLHLNLCEHVVFGEINKLKLNLNYLHHSNISYTRFFYHSPKLNLFSTGVTPTS